MYVAIRFRLVSAFVLFAFLLCLAVAAAFEPGAATTAPQTASAQALDRLRVAPEGPRAGYSRAAFPHWVDADGDGCNTREEVLIAESTTPAQVDQPGCRVVAGDWVSPYDGVTVTSPAELEIDHVVALAEAWDSGAAGWTTERRQAFANDRTKPMR
ncbi:MAG: HNH endonuclease family protein [Actinobacteria bacterium]|nr:HNH endonuclease family protein [Actinomycetota bacterium]